MRRFDPEPLSTSHGIMHNLDARARLLAALILLGGVSVSGSSLTFVCVAVLILAALILARVHPGVLLVRTIAILALPMMFVVFSLLAGDQARAVLLLVRSTLSVGVLILFAATTKLPELTRTLAGLGVPEVLTDTIQLVYRYLFVLTDEALRMRDAVQCRGGSSSLPAAAGSLGVLFARSYSRAERVHWAMLSRGYTGGLPSTESGRNWGVPEAAVLLISVASVTAGLLLP
ncbi:MAG: hypothetical protein H7039_08800 [Bryobacteraceae bacterium]|nr:hypothetical protein [Bryobacteraceae bacterium]